MNETYKNLYVKIGNITRTLQNISPQDTFKSLLNKALDEYKIPKNRQDNFIISSPYLLNSNIIIGSIYDNLYKPITIEIRLKIIPLGEGEIPQKFSDFINSDYFYNFKHNTIPYNVVIVPGSATTNIDNTPSSFLYNLKQQIPLYDLLIAFKEGKDLCIFLLDKSFKYDNDKSMKVLEMLQFEKSIINSDIVYFSNSNKFITPNDIFDLSNLTNISKTDILLNIYNCLLKNVKIYIFIISSNVPHMNSYDILDINNKNINYGNYTLDIHNVFPENINDKSFIIRYISPLSREKEDKIVINEFETLIEDKLIFC